MTADADQPKEPARDHLRLGQYELAASTEFGPRVTGLWSGDSPNLFAVLGPDVRIEIPGIEDYLFRGGHRLWVAPEIPEVTYAAEAAECKVGRIDDLVEVSAPPDGAGFAKAIQLSHEGGRLDVDHEIIWNGATATTIAPWAITQLPPGGVAILPLDSPRSEPGSQADRTLVLWPYTRLDDPRIIWLDRAVAIEATAGTALKLGAGPEPRTLAYYRDGILFTKEFDALPGSNHADRGATAQVFLNDDFCELETLGPMATLEPGASASHREHWEVTRCSSLDEALEIVLEGSPE